ncbi:MAG: hypothetical protein WA081_13760 [Desulfosalsimonadaceae bacterium]
MPIPYIANGRFVDFYPLKQFAPVIHGSHQAQGRLAMGSHRRKSVALFSRIRSMPGKKPGKK